MQFVFKVTNWQHFQNEVSSLAAQLNSKPHIVTVVIEDIEEVVRITPEARAEVDSLLAETTGTKDKEKTQ